MIRQYWETLRFIYQKPSAWVITVLGSGVIGFIFFYFTYFDLTVGNLGMTFALTQVILQMLIALLFGINLAIFSGKVALAASAKKKSAAATTLGAIVSIIVAGCPACGITLASYLGIATIFTALPFYGLELKLLGFGLLLFSILYLLRKYGQCQR